MSKLLTQYYKSLNCDEGSDSDSDDSTSSNSMSFSMSSDENSKIKSSKKSKKKKKKKKKSSKKKKKIYSSDSSVSDESNDIKKKKKKRSKLKDDKKALHKKLKLNVKRSSTTNSEDVPSKKSKPDKDASFSSGINDAILGAIEKEMTANASQTISEILDEILGNPTGDSNKIDERKILEEALKINTKNVNIKQEKTDERTVINIKKEKIEDERKSKRTQEKDAQDKKKEKKSKDKKLEGGKDKDSSHRKENRDYRKHEESRSKNNGESKKPVSKDELNNEDNTLVREKEIVKESKDLDKSLDDASQIENQAEKDKKDNDLPVPAVADVFVEDLLASQDSDMLTVNGKEKTKSTAGKIMIANLKQSTVYDKVVKEVEEAEKKKREKYEEGEISSEGGNSKHSSSEDESSVTSKEKSKKKKSSYRSKRHTDDKRRSHRHRKHRSRDRNRSTERNRSRSPDSSSRHKRSHHHHSKSYRASSKSRSSSRERCYPKHYSSYYHPARTQSPSLSPKSDHRHKRKSSPLKSVEDTRSKSPISEATKIDKRKLLEIAKKNAKSMMKQGILPVTSLSSSSKSALKSRGKNLNELTDFCKLLSKKDADGQETVSSDSDYSDDSTESPFFHPFQIKERSSAIVMNIKNSLALPTKSLQEKAAEQSKQLSLQFPVSSGSQHRKTESEWVPVSPPKDTPTALIPVSTPVISNAVANSTPASSYTAPVALINHLNFSSVGITPVETQVALPLQIPQLAPPPPPPPPQPVVFNEPNLELQNMDIGAVVAQRIQAMRRLTHNPNDPEAKNMLYHAQKKMQAWAESKQTPGQFTGSTDVRILTPQELASGNQAWVKKDQLQVATPVSGGMGMHLLQKMGWSPGEGLGKNKEGALVPLQLEIKFDKKGLVAKEELPQKKNTFGRRGGPPNQGDGQYNWSTGRNLNRPPNVGEAPPRPPPLMSLDGKHPVSLIQEYCSRRKMGAPRFVEVSEVGPPHRKKFIFKENETQILPLILATRVKPSYDDSEMPRFDPSSLEPLDILLSDDATAEEFENVVSHTENTKSNDIYKTELSEYNELAMLENNEKLQQTYENDANSANYAYEASEECSYDTNAEHAYDANAEYAYGSHFDYTRLDVSGHISYDENNEYAYGANPLYAYSQEHENDFSEKKLPLSADEYYSYYEKPTSPVGVSPNIGKVSEQQETNENRFNLDENPVSPSDDKKDGITCKTNEQKYLEQPKSNGQSEAHISASTLQTIFLSYMYTSSKLPPNARPNANILNSLIPFINSSEVKPLNDCNKSKESISSLTLASIDQQSKTHSKNEEFFKPKSSHIERERGRSRRSVTVTRIPPRLETRNRFRHMNRLQCLRKSPERKLFGEYISKMNRVYNRGNRMHTSRDTNRSKETDKRNSWHEEYKTSQDEKIQSHRQSEKLKSEDNAKNESDSGKACDHVSIEYGEISVMPLDLISVGSGEISEKRNNLLLSSIETSNKLNTNEGSIQLVNLGDECDSSSIESGEYEPGEISNEDEDDFSFSDSDKSKKQCRPALNLGGLDFSFSNFPRTENIKQTFNVQDTGKSDKTLHLPGVKAADNIMQHSPTVTILDRFFPCSSSDRNLKFNQHFPKERTIDKNLSHLSHKRGPYLPRLSDPNRKLDYFRDRVTETNENTSHLFRPGVLHKTLTPITTLIDKNLSTAKLHLSEAKILSLVQSKNRIMKNRSKKKEQTDLTLDNTSKRDYKPPDVEQWIKKNFPAMLKDMRNQIKKEAQEKTQSLTVGKPNPINDDPGDKNPSNNKDRCSYVVTNEMGERTGDIEIISIISSNEKMATITDEDVALEDNIVSNVKQHLDQKVVHIITSKNEEMNSVAVNYLTNSHPPTEKDCLNADIEISNAHTTGSSQNIHDVIPVESSNVKDGSDSTIMKKCTQIQNSNEEIVLSEVESSEEGMLSEENDFKKAGPVLSLAFQLIEKFPLKELKSVPNNSPVYNKSPKTILSEPENDSESTQPIISTQKSPIQKSNVFSGICTSLEIQENEPIIPLTKLTERQPGCKKDNEAPLCSDGEISLSGSEDSLVSTSHLLPENQQKLLVDEIPSLMNTRVPTPDIFHSKPADLSDDGRPPSPKTMYSINGRSIRRRSVSPRFRNRRLPRSPRNRVSRSPRRRFSRSSGRHVSRSPIRRLPPSSRRTLSGSPERTLTMSPRSVSNAPSISLHASSRFIPEVQREIFSHSPEVFVDLYPASPIGHSPSQSRYISEDNSSPEQLNIRKMASSPEVILHFNSTSLIPTPNIHFKKEGLSLFQHEENKLPFFQSQPSGLKISVNFHPKIPESLEETLDLSSYPRYNGRIISGENQDDFQIFSRSDSTEPYVLPEITTANEIFEGTREPSPIFNVRNYSTWDESTVYPCSNHSNNISLEDVSRNYTARDNSENCSTRNDLRNCHTSNADYPIQNESRYNLNVDNIKTYTTRDSSKKYSARDNSRNLSPVEDDSRNFHTKPNARNYFSIDGNTRNISATNNSRKYPTRNDSRNYPPQNRSEIGDNHERISNSTVDQNRRNHERNTRFVERDNEIHNRRFQNTNTRKTNHNRTRELNRHPTNHARRENQRHNQNYSKPYGRSEHPDSISRGRRSFDEQSALDDADDSELFNATHLLRQNRPFKQTNRLSGYNNTENRNRTKNISSR